MLEIGVSLLVSNTQHALHARITICVSRSVFSSKLIKLKDNQSFVISSQVHCCCRSRGAVVSLCAYVLNKCVYDVTSGNTFRTVAPV